MALLYKDGKTEPKVQDTVMGDGFKGRVSRLLKDAVVVTSRGPWDPKASGSEKLIERELDPSSLDLVHRS